MESIVEDVEDQRQTEGKPAHSQRCKNFAGWNVFGNSEGVNQSGLLCIRSQLDDDINREAIYRTINKIINYCKKDPFT